MAASALAAPPAPKRFACPRCGQAQTLRSPKSALTVMCSACGALVGLNFPQPQVVSSQSGCPLPTGWLSVGVRGSISAELGSIALGRLHLRDGDTSWDLWFLELSDGRSVLVQEAEGRLELLVPFEPSDRLSEDDRENAQPGEAVRFAGGAPEIVARRTLTLAAQEGETPSMAWIGDSLQQLDLLDVDDGPLRILWTPEQTWHTTVQSIDETLMWSLTGQLEPLSAMAQVDGSDDGAKQLAQRLATVGGTLLGFGLVLAMLSATVSTAVEPMGRSWARFDAADAGQVQDEPLASLPLGGSPGHYAVDVSCDVSSTTDRVELVAVDPQGRAWIMATCEGGSTRRHGSLLLRTRSLHSQPTQIFARHRADRRLRATDNLEIDVNWHLADARWSAGAALLMTVLGGLAAVVGFGLPYLARRRAEMALEEARLRAQVLAAVRARRAQEQES